MKTKTNFAREVQHFLLGAGLSLLVVAVTPVGARYLAEVAPTGGGSTAPVSQPVSQPTVQPVTQPVTEPVKSEPTTVQQTQQASPVSIPVTPDGGIKTGGTTENLGVPGQCPSGETGTPPNCSGALQGGQKPISGQQTDSQLQQGGLQQLEKQGTGQQQTQRSQGRSQGKAYGTTGDAPGKAYGLEKNTSGRGYGVQGGENEGGEQSYSKVRQPRSSSSGESEGEDGAMGGLSKSRSSRQQPSFFDDASGENTENSTSRSRGKQSLIYGNEEGGEAGGSSKSRPQRQPSFFDSESDEGQSSSQKRPSSNFFEFDRGSMFQVSSKSKVKSKDIKLVIDEEEESDPAEKLQEFKDAFKKVNKLKTKSKVESNAVAMFQAIETFCENEVLECDFLEEAAEDFEGASAKQMKKILKTALSDLEDLYNEEIGSVEEEE